MKKFDRTKKMFHPGDVIKVKSGDLKKTHKYFGVESKMCEIQRDKRKVVITSVIPSTNSGAGAISAGGYTWHPEDVYVVKYVREDPLVVDGPEGVFKFDPQTL